MSGEEAPKLIKHHDKPRELRNFQDRGLKTRGWEKSQWIQYSSRHISTHGRTFTILLCSLYRTWSSAPMRVRAHTHKTAGAQMWYWLNKCSWNKPLQTIAIVLGGLLLIAAVVMCSVLHIIKLMISKTAKLITGQFQVQIHNTTQLNVLTEEGHVYKEMAPQCYLQTLE